MRMQAFHRSTRKVVIESVILPLPSPAAPTTMMTSMTVLFVLQLVGQLATQKGSTESPYQSMTLLAAQIVSCNTSKNGTAQSSFSFRRIRILGRIRVLTLMTLLVRIVRIVRVVLPRLVPIPALLVVLAVWVITAVILALSATALLSSGLE